MVADGQAEGQVRIPAGCAISGIYFMRMSMPRKTVNVFWIAISIW